MTLSKKSCVSIIILNWNGSKLTIDCLSSIANDHYKNKEIIVVDNGSTDNSVEKIKSKNNLQKINF
jgi:GT2 family glycosyltransferase